MKIKYFYFNLAINVVTCTIAFQETSAVFTGWTAAASSDTTLSTTQGSIPIFAQKWDQMALVPLTPAISVEAAIRQSALVVDAETTSLSAHGVGCPQDSSAAVVENHVSIRLNSKEGPRIALSVGRPECVWVPTSPTVVPDQVTVALHHELILTIGAHNRLVGSQFTMRIERVGTGDRRDEIEQRGKRETHSS